MNPFDLESEKFRILFGDLYQLADKVDESAREIGRIVNVMHGSETGRGVLSELETIRDSIAEAATALEPIVGAALPEKIDALKAQIDGVPNVLIAAADTSEFKSQIGEVMVEASQHLIERAKQDAQYSFNAHLHEEAGKAVSAAVKAAVEEHLEDAANKRGYIESLKVKCASLEEKVADLAERNTRLKSGLSPWPVMFSFGAGWVASIVAHEIWIVGTTWIFNQPLPLWLQP